MNFLPDANSKENFLTLSNKTKYKHKYTKKIFPSLDISLCLLIIRKLRVTFFGKIKLKGNRIILELFTMISIIS